MRKILLTLGASASAIIPVVSVVACSTALPYDIHIEHPLGVKGSSILTAKLSHKTEPFVLKTEDENGNVTEVVQENARKFAMSGNKFEDWELNSVKAVAKEIMLTISSLSDKYDDSVVISFKINQAIYETPDYSGQLIGVTDSSVRGTQNLSDAIRAFITDYSTVKNEKEALEVQEKSFKLIAMEVAEQMANVKLIKKSLL